MQSMMVPAGAVLIAAAIALGTLTTLDMRTERARGGLAAATAAKDASKRKARRAGSRPWAERHVAGSGLDVTGGQWLAAVAALAGAAALVAHGLLGAWPVTALAALTAVIAAEAFLSVRKRSRTRAFDGQLARALPQIAQNLRAGISPERAVKAVAEDSPEPLAGELRRVSAEASITADLAGAFDALAARTGSKDVMLIATAVRIVKTQGGSLAEILENVAGVLESRQEMVRYAAAQTASTRATAILLVVMTVLLAIGQGFMQEGYIEFYRDRFEGWVVVGAAAALELIGYLAICKISDIKVD